MFIFIKKLTMKTRFFSPPKGLDGEETVYPTGKFKNPSFKKRCVLRVRLALIVFV
jgi:hypothetical protein